MFGFKTVKATELDALRAKINALEGEVKGYYENRDNMNAYFKAIAPLLKGPDLDSFTKSITRQELKRVYETNGPAYGIINKIARATGEMFSCLELQRWRGGKWEDVEQHWILDLLHHPNDRYSCQRFGQAWTVNRLVYGDAEIYAPVLVGKRKGEGKEMYIIPGHRAELQKGGYRAPLEGLTVTGGGSSEIIETKNFFMSFNYNLEDTSFYGTSPLVVAAVYLSVIDKGMARQGLELQNGGPSALVTPKPDNLGVMPASADSLTEELNGEEVKGQIKALRTAIEVHQLGSSSVDLGILASHKEAVNALCFIYDIPVDLYYGQSKYENAKEAKKALYENNAVPLANEFAADLLSHYKLDSDFRLQVNTDRVDVLQEKPGDVLENLTKMHATLNEMREAYGYERIEEEWADKPIFGMATTFGAENYDINEE